MHSESLKSKYITEKGVNSSWFTVIVVTFFTFIVNFKTWQLYTEHHSINSLSNVLQMLSFVLFIFFVLLAVFSVFNFKYVQKVVYIVLLLVSAPVLYFSMKFNVLFDSSMIKNALTTDVREASELITTSFILVYIFAGIIPSILVWKVPITYKPFAKRLSCNVMQIPAAVALALMSAYPFYGELSSYVRAHRTQVLYSFLPYAPLYAFYKNYRASLGEENIVKELIDKDAHITTKVNTSVTKPLVVVVVIGETARHKSFVNSQTSTSESTPLLNRKNLVYFDNFWSCGTNTEASLPCMFSSYTKESFEPSYNLQYENVTELIQRVGYNVFWKGNNHCKGICENIDHVHINTDTSSAYEHDGEFYDEALIANLGSNFSKSNSDQVMFLHEAGSHGPAYFKRIPDEFKLNQPACLSADFANCSDVEITNAYNNTIIYTKHVLGLAIDELKQIDNRFDSILIYLSDHGESTGEHGYYLHGLPYIIAPDEQTHIPALIWMSDSYIKNRRVNLDCLKNHASTKYNHDNFSHTMLGILNIETSAYSSELDLFDHCIN